MTTETTEEPETIPMTESMEVGGDLEAAVVEEHELARATDEGMVGIPHPIPGDGEVDETLQAEEPERRIAIDLKARELFAERHKARNLAIKESEAKRVYDKAKKATESQDDFVKFLTDELESIFNDEPGRQRVLPFEETDKAKAGIDAAFPKPEAIAPLRADTLEEHMRRKLEATPIGEMGLKKGTHDVLEKLELATAGKVKRHFDGVFNAWTKPQAVKGMTDARLEELADAFAELGTAAKVEFEGIATAEEATEADDEYREQVLED